MLVADCASPPEGKWNSIRLLCFHDFYDSNDTNNKNAKSCTACDDIFWHTQRHSSFDQSFERRRIWPLTAGTMPHPRATHCRPRNCRLVVLSGRDDLNEHRRAGAPGPPGSITEKPHICFFFDFVIFFCFLNMNPWSRRIDRTAAISNTKICKPPP